MLKFIFSIMFLLNYMFPANPVRDVVYAASLPFDDISSSYAQKQILNLYQKNIISGTGNGKFEPNKPITRAEFVSMISRLLHVEPVMNDIPSFGDVPQGQWFYGWVQSAINLNIVQGTGPYTFEPYKEISRQEAATMIDRAFKGKGQYSAASVLPYHDRSNIASWAVPYVNEIAGLGLMTGDASGYFRPADRLTRQEAAVVFDRVLQNANWAKQLSTVPAATVQIGWQFGETTDQFINRIQQSRINTVSPRWFFLEDTGVVSNHSESKLMDWAAANGVKVWAMFGNRFNSDATHRMLADAQQRKAVIGQVTDYARQYHLGGINLDFENVSPQDRQAFTNFVSELAKALHGLNQKLSIDVSPDTGTDWTDAFDYKALGETADYMVLMGYDEHYDGSPAAGSVSSLSWLQKSLDKLLTVVPPSKTIAALPFYTRDWSLGAAISSEDLTLEQQGERLKATYAARVWDAILGQYVASYSLQGKQHRIWIEDSRSLSLKYSLAQARGIAGFAYWYVDAETADVWTSLHNAAQYDSYHF